jgi:hypothetical protein
VNHLIRSKLDLWDYGLLLMELSGAASSCLKLKNMKIEALFSHFDINSVLYLLCLAVLYMCIVLIFEGVQLCLA